LDSYGFYADSVQLLFAGGSAASRVISAGHIRPRKAIWFNDN